MKVILTHEVTGLGTAGDVVDVKDGYARNFLLRRGLGHGLEPRALPSRWPRSRRAASPRGQDPRGGQRHEGSA